MRTININPNQVISMNDYPPLHSPKALRKYHVIFKNGRADTIIPIPVIPVSIVVPYLQKQDSRFKTYKEELERFLRKHQNAEYFMFDGTHRAAGAMLSASKIPAYLIKTDKDIKKLLYLKENGKIAMSGLKINLSETMRIIEEHYHRTNKFWTLEEKVKTMISNKDIDRKIIEHYNKKRLSELLSFGKEIISICKKLGVVPILYGSYLLRHYTKDKSVSPQDIDFYVPKGFNEKMIKIIKKKKWKYKHLEEWYSLMITKGNVKVDLDEIDFLYDGPKDFESFNFDGKKIKCLSINGLASIYKKSIASSREPEKSSYILKYNLLRKIAKR